MKVTLFVLIALVLAGCGQGPSLRLDARSAKPGDNAPELGLVLVSQAGEGKTDNEIRRYQQQVRSGTNDVALERLGWLFIAKARESFDPGYYKLAEQCGLCLRARHPGQPEELLLRVTRCKACIASRRPSHWREN
jgi:hypothetical protein